MRAVRTADVSSEARAEVQSSFARQTCVMDVRERLEARRWGRRVSRGVVVVVVVVVKPVVVGSGGGGGWIREEVEEAICWEDERLLLLAGFGSVLFSVFGFFSPPSRRWLYISLIHPCFVVRVV